MVCVFCGRLLNINSASRNESMKLDLIQIDMYVNLMAFDKSSRLAAVYSRFRMGDDNLCPIDFIIL